MPIFDYVCSSLNCNGRRKDCFVRRYNDKVLCPACGAVMSQLLPVSFSAHCFPADGIHLKHVSATGKTFKSKMEMVRYARKHDLELSALL